MATGCAVDTGLSLLQLKMLEVGDVYCNKHFRLFFRGISSWMIWPRRVKHERWFGGVPCESLGVKIHQLWSTANSWLTFTVYHFDSWQDVDKENQFYHQFLSVLSIMTLQAFGVLAHALYYLCPNCEDNGPPAAIILGVICTQHFGHLQCMYFADRSCSICVVSLPVRYICSKQKQHLVTTWSHLTG